MPACPCRVAPTMANIRGPKQAARPRLNKINRHLSATSAASAGKTWLALVSSCSRRSRVLFNILFVNDEQSLPHFGFHFSADPGNIFPDFNVGKVEYARTSPTDLCGHVSGWSWGYIQGFGKQTTFNKSSKLINLFARKAKLASSFKRW